MTPDPINSVNAKSANYVELKSANPVEKTGFDYSSLWTKAPNNDVKVPFVSTEPNDMVLSTVNAMQYVEQNGDDLANMKVTYGPNGPASMLYTV